MSPLRLLGPLCRAALTLVVCAALASPLLAQQPTSGIGVVVSASPMYLTPDPSRTPLTTLQPGTRLRVVTREGDWYRVIFSDPYLGERTGYVLVATIRIEPAPPMPAPRPQAVPGQIAPASPAEPVVTQATPMAKPWNTGYISLNATTQRESTAFTVTSSDPQSGAIVTTSYHGVHPSSADVAIGQRVWGGLHVAVGLTWSSQIADADVAAIVPSPLAGNLPRAISGTVGQIHHQELGLHLDAGWALANDRFEIVVFGGPSVFHIKQDLVTGVGVIETPPAFATASFASATIVESSRTHLGGNAGLDGSVRLWKALGVGVLVRYSQAKIPFTPAAGTSVTIKAGGLQYGGGLRFRF